MNKVYIILTQGEDSCYVKGVFCNKKLAIEYYNEYCLEENQWEESKIVEEEIITTSLKGITGFCIKMNKKGFIKSISRVDDEDIENEKGYLKLTFENNSIYMEGVFEGKNKQDAICNANKKRTELIRTGEWCVRE